MADQTSQTPSAEQVLDELLRTIHDSLKLADQVIRGETVDLGGGYGMSVPTLGDRLATARHIVEIGSPLSERLHALQKTRSGGARGI